MDAREWAFAISSIAAFLLYSIVFFYFLLPILGRSTTGILWLVTAAVIYGALEYYKIKERRQKLMKKPPVSI